MGPDGPGWAAQGTVPGAKRRLIETVTGTAWRTQNRAASAFADS